jgi:adenosylhomocysteine nucleosidase
MTGLVGVVAAMPEELAPLLAITGPEGRVTRLGGVAVVLRSTGEGTRNARRGVAELLARQPIRALLVVGFAGALTPGLPMGSVVIAERVHAQDGRCFRPSGPLVDAGARATGAARVGVWTRTDLVATAAEKARLARSLPESADEPTLPAVVDLESSAFADVARMAQIPWGILRVVSDAADEEVPAFLASCRDGDGAISRSRVVLSSLARPARMAALLGLRRRAQSCARQLSNGAIRWLPQFAETIDVAARR